MPENANGHWSHERTWFGVEKLALFHYNDRDTHTVRVDGKERGEIDSTRDCTGDWWACPIIGERKRFTGPDSMGEAIRYLAGESA